MLVSQDGDFQLTTAMDESRFLLGESNQKYFEKIVKNGKEGQIQFYNLAGNSKDKSLVNYLWFGDPRDESCLGASYGGLNSGCGAFGVLGSAEGSAQKNGYTLTQIGKANSEIIPVVFERAKISGLASLVMRDLNKTLLEELKKQ